MAQYPIPQFIEQEGKIISFLTFRQFFILVGGGAVIAICFYIMPFAVFAGVAIGVIIVVSVIAFFKIDDQPVLKVLLNMFAFTTKSKTYVWKKKEQPYPFKTSLRQQEAARMKEITNEDKGSRLKSTKGMVEYRKKWNEGLATRD